MTALVTFDPLQVISNTLSRLPSVLASADDPASSSADSDRRMIIAKQVNAAFAALGGFHETIKPGCLVQVMSHSVSPH